MDKDHVTLFMYYPYSKGPFFSCLHPLCTFALWPGVSCLPFAEFPKSEATELLEPRYKVAQGSRWHRNHLCLSLEPLLTQLPLACGSSPWKSSSGKQSIVGSSVFTSTDPLIPFYYLLVLWISNHNVYKVGKHLSYHHFYVT